MAFEDFEFDTEQFALTRSGALVAVEPRVFDVLAYPIAHADRVVQKRSC